MNDPSINTINKLPAARGLAWLAGSWELVRRQPIRLLLISLFFQFFLSFSQADLLGLLVVMCLPALWTWPLLLPVTGKKRLKR